MAADTGMETSPSPEITDSRKRPLDLDSENGDVKRSHFSSVQDLVTALPMANGHTPNMVEATYHFKVLIPSMVAGAIIGKGGETIAQLQKETGARVKMSKSHDYYPGTSERACLITGSVEGIMVVLEFIMEKIKEKPELLKPLDGIDAKMPQDRDKQVKILVPNSTAGMIIGKGGNYIKQIKEQSGSYVQISQKAKELSLQERCITVVGDKENNKKACMMILQKVVDDPQSGSCPNVSYADVSGPVANYNPTGSPYAVNAPEVNEGVSLASSVGSVLVNGSGVGALSLALGPSPGAASPLTQHSLEHYKMALRQAGFSESGVGEMSSALAVFAKHGVPVSLPALPAPTLPYFAGESVFAPMSQVGLAAMTPLPLGGFAPLLPLSSSPTPAEPGCKDAKNVHIPEVIVGAILGPGGRSLVEIQQLSGANIQISKKGTFAPGTRDRIVTISGSQTAINHAHLLIQRKVEEEDLKRTRQNQLSTLMQ